MINLLEELQKASKQDETFNNKLIKGRSFIIRSIKISHSEKFMSDTCFLYAENVDDPKFSRWIKGRTWGINWLIEPKSLINKRVIINGWFVVKHRYTYIHSIVLNGEECFKHELPLDRFKSNIEYKLSVSDNKKSSTEEDKVDQILGIKKQD